VERQSASAYFTWDVTWTLWNPTFYWPVRYTQCSCRVYPRHGAHSTEKYPFWICCKIFLKDIVFMFWHDIMYIELLHCVTNFELVWTWNKVTMFENAKKCRLYSTLPYILLCAKSREFLWNFGNFEHIFREFLVNICGCEPVQRALFFSALSK